MLPSEQLKAALSWCSVETLWKPAHTRGILAIPLVDEGVAGGAFIPGAGARNKYQALVIAVNETRNVKVGDLVCYDSGRAEEIVTFAGESFVYTTEKMLSGVDEEFSRA